MKRKRTKPDSTKQPVDRSLGLEAAAPWRVFECLVASEWRDTTRLTEIVISKEPPFGGVVSCTFLVDLGCLGLKQGFVSQFRTKREYEDVFRAMMLARIPMSATAYPLTVKIIRESVRHARELGFTPSHHAQRALSALGPLDVADECPEVISVGGPDGRPYCVAGPDDDVDHIVATLIRKCGAGNFSFTAPLGTIPPGFFD